MTMDLWDSAVRLEFANSQVVERALQARTSPVRHALDTLVPEWFDRWRWSVAGLDGVIRRPGEALEKWMATSVWEWEAATREAAVELPGGVFNDFVNSIEVVNEAEFRGTSSADRAARRVVLALRDSSTWFLVTDDPCVARRAVSEFRACPTEENPFASWA